MNIKQLYQEAYRLARMTEGCTLRGRLHRETVRRLCLRFYEAGGDSGFDRRAALVALAHNHLCAGLYR